MTDQAVLAAPVDDHAGRADHDHLVEALVEDLIKTLDKFKVPEKEKGELLGALGPMKGDILIRLFSDQGRPLTPELRINSSVSSGRSGGPSTRCNTP